MPQTRVTGMAVLGKRLFKQADIPRQQRPQDQPRRELTARAKVADQRSQFGPRSLGRDRHRRLLAGFPHDPPGAIGFEPIAFDDKTGERLGKLRDQRLARRRRDVVAGEQGLANGRKMAEPFDDAIDRVRREIGRVIFHEDQTRLLGTNLGDCRRNRTRQRGGRRWPLEFPRRR